ncbi:aldehyde dehydrogenase family protein [Halostreptopolyspora alba]|uniref:Aldehyde dehydrogenase n=1 Tax=Halostreptopolyspora alba TaxID=2487137 RepID=A0A3N0E2Y6_9ACTN|nr:aldehyde dehydrogenase family protein [Nocardiopsaceae bacterium YIM 96095]
MTQERTPASTPPVGTGVPERRGTVDHAVRTARRVAPAWAKLSFKTRRELLSRWKRLMVAKLDELTTLITDETGKPHADALLEVSLTAEHLHWAARNSHRVLGTRRVRSGPLGIDQSATLGYEPLGVVGVIGPWNYPLFTPMGSISYALAAGNAVVFKPSELTPGVGEWLATTFAAATGHTGVLQTVTGDGEAGAALCASGTDKIAFTGSAETARAVMAQCAQTLTPIVAECGGKDAMIVDSGADLDAAAEAAVFGAMGNAGQTCVGVERVYVLDDLHEEFTRKVVALASGITPGETPDADYGPMTTRSQADTVHRHVVDALERGGRAVLGGTDSVEGRMVTPVVLVDVPEDASAVTEETFGPTLVVNRVADAEEALRRANASEYGLGGVVFSGDRRRALRLARRMRAGAVSIGAVIAFAAIPALPFGGTGASGFGRIHGADGLREFSRAKSVTRRRFRLPINVVSFARTPKDIALTRSLLTRRHG